MTEFPNLWLLARSCVPSNTSHPEAIDFRRGTTSLEVLHPFPQWVLCCWSSLRLEMHLSTAISILQAWNIVKSSDVGLDCNIPKPTEKWGQANQHKHHRLSLHFHQHKRHGKYWKYWKNNYKYLTCPCGGMNTWNHKPHNLLKIMSEKWEEYSGSWEIQRYPWLLPDP